MISAEVVERFIQQAPAAMQPQLRMLPQPQIEQLISDAALKFNGENNKRSAHNHISFQDQGSDLLVMKVAAQYKRMCASKSLETSDDGFLRYLNAQGANASLRCEYCAQFPGSAAMKRCARCRSVYYCSNECQRASWKAEPIGHRLKCDSLASVQQQVDDLTGNDSKYWPWSNLSLSLGSSCVLALRGLLQSGFWDKSQSEESQRNDKWGRIFAREVPQYSKLASKKQAYLLPDASSAIKVTDWRSWHEWRHLPPTSPIALGYSECMSIAHVLKEAIALRGDKVVTNARIHIVDTELSLVPETLYELVLLFPTISNWKINLAGRHRSAPLSFTSPSGNTISVIATREFEDWATSLRSAANTVSDTFELLCIFPASETETKTRHDDQQQHQHKLQVLGTAANFVFGRGHSVAVIESSINADAAERTAEILGRMRNSCAQNANTSDELLADAISRMQMVQTSSTNPFYRPDKSLRNRYITALYYK